MRSRQYLAEAVQVPASAADAHVIGLACIDDDAQGEPLQVLWEKEADAAILRGAGWERLAQRGFDAPTLFSAYLHTLRWNCVTATNPRLFQAPFRAGIKLDAYQIEPLRKALLLPRVNLFIADDVGLGKTIEAGLIARELVLRKKVRDIVVACPPSVLPQWQSELEQRFGLGFEVLDKEFFARVRRERGFSTNPWTTHSRFLASHRLLVDDGYTGPMRDWLGTFRPGSLLILDEAHHAAPATGSRYAIDSKLTRAVRDLAPRFEHRLFLSATPHNGHSNSFSALLEILDPQRFCRGVKVQKKQLDAVMVRRLKEDIREVLDGGFPKRQVAQLTIDGLPEDSVELRLTGLLDEYRRLREGRLSDASKRTQAAAALLTTGLQQRLLSSVEAFARTLRVHRRTLERQRSVQPGAAPTPPPGLFDLAGGGVGPDDDRATLPPEALAREEDAHVAAATEAGFRAAPDAAESRLLDEMTRLADAARGRPDARVRKLVEWVRERMCPAAALPGQPRGTDTTWSDTRVIVFTEYEDTLRYLREQLDAAVAGTDRADQRIALYRGSTSPADREEVKRAFNADPAKHPLRILLCTDAAREGINLQAHCADLFHFDVPWNPSRMEQRNGRIDRKLQPAAEVRCHYFVYRQRPEDRILAALVRKTEVIKRELGSLAQVIEGRLADTLARRGIRRTTLDQLEREIEAADLDGGSKAVVAEELEAARERQSELKDQIDALRTRLGESQRWVGLREADFRAALSCSLELAGAEPLHGRAAGSPAYDFPAVDRTAGGDASWAETIDALRTPRERGVPFWQWRRTSAIRPVVFTDPGTMTDEVVHLHLEHPVVRRLLGRFTAQGFVHHDLSRACFAQTTDSVPRVILLGRLCLYGAEAARLHEEVLAVTARWVEPDRRKGPLAPYAREAEGNTLELLEQALAKGVQPASDVILRRLQATGPQDVAELLPHLEARGRQVAAEARDRLAARGTDEAQAMTDVLLAQKKRIAEAAAKTAKNTAQLLLEFADDERKQLEADRLHWGRRLGEIDQELATEPDRIRNGYAVTAERVEPVGVAYLWPVTG